MKTNEELIKELFNLADNISLAEDLMREIRLNAWKQGMTDAASICADRELNKLLLTDEEKAQCRILKERIREESEKLP